MGKRKRRKLPSMILWDRRDQMRSIDAVEKLAGLVGDLEVMLAAKRRRSAAAALANATRKAAAAGSTSSANGPAGKDGAH